MSGLTDQNLPPEGDDEDVAEDWESMLDSEGGEGGGDGDGEDDDLAAEWETMMDGDDDDGGGGGETTRVLNQDEIDSLLGFDDDGDDMGEQSGIQAILNSAMVSYERLPMLEVVFDRLVRMMSTSLRNFTSDNVEVSLDNILSLRFGDYLKSIRLSMCCLAGVAARLRCGLKVGPIPRLNVIWWNG